MWLPRLSIAIVVTASLLGPSLVALPAPTAAALDVAGQGPVPLSGPSSGVRGLPSVLSLNDRVVLAVWAAESPSGGEQVYIARSTDAGATWAAARALSAVQNHHGVSPSLVAQGDLALVAWTALGGAGAESKHVWAVHSRDSGATWSEPNDVSGDTGGADDFGLGADASTAVLVWKQVTGRTATLMSRSLVEQTGEWTEVVALAGSAGHGSPSVVVVAGIVTVAVVRIQPRDTSTVETASRGVAVATWDPWVVAAASSGIASIRSIEGSGSLRTLAYAYETTNGSGVTGAVVVSSIDAAASWVEATALGAEERGYARIARATAGGTHYVAVAWQGRGILLFTSDDEGQSWSHRSWVPDSERFGSSLSIHASGSSVALVARWSGPLSQSFDAIIRSVDAGRTWDSPRLLDTAEGYVAGAVSASVAERIIAVTTLRGGTGEVPVAFTRSMRLTPSSPAEPAVRLFGADRYATSAAIAREFPSFDGEEGSVVLVATGEDFPDALVAANVAGLRDAPLLLVRRASIPAVIAEEVQRLKPATVIIAGGEGVISADVEARIRVLSGGASVQRVAGQDRYLTSLFLGREGRAHVETVYIATGRVFADALVAAPVASSRSARVLLVDGARSSVPESFLGEIGIGYSSGLRRVVIVGGVGAVSTGIENQIRAAGPDVLVERIGGADRYETARLLVEDGGPYSEHAYVASGATFPDALSGAALAGATRAALYAMRPTCVAPQVRATLSTQQSVTVLGGVGAVTVDPLTGPVCLR